MGFKQFGLAHVGPAVRGFDPLFDPFCIWGNEFSMNIGQVKKLIKIVRIKTLVTKKDLCLYNEEDISSLQDGTNYYTLAFIFLCPNSNLEKIFMHIFVFRPFQSSSLMITSQTTCMVRMRGRYSYNTHGTILKSSLRRQRMDGQSPQALA